MREQNLPEASTLPSGKIIQAGDTTGRNSVADEPTALDWF
jgi:hypothetical protein